MKKHPFPNVIDLGKAPAGAKANLILHITSQAKGALPNRTRIVKCASVEGDTNPDGTFGYVTGSMVLTLVPRTIGYFIEWDTFPGTPVFTQSFKIKRAINDDPSRH